MATIKTTLSILIVSVGISSCFFTNKSPGEIYTSELRLIVDTTDPATILPDSMAVLTYFGVHTDKDNGAAVTITTITDKELNPSVTIRLPDIAASTAVKNSSDIHMRDKEIVFFYGNVMNELNKINQAGRGKTYAGHSECFRALCKQLSGLTTNASAGKKEVWVFGDMLENSDLFDAYNQPLVTEGQRGDLIEKLEKTNLLPPDLSRITVRFFYTPKSREDDGRFGAMISIYQTLLQKRGATVTVQANN